jgi:hypothetical protein
MRLNNYEFRRDIPCLGKQTKDVLCLQKARKVYKILETWNV